MKWSLNKLLLSALLLSLSAMESFAALPPKYLAVKEFKKCLGSKQIETYSAWCMPAKKTAICSKESWSQLKALRGKDKLPSC
ncbi:hypothetical protein R6242_14160 [Iodobacter sp. CM08]|uniref:hypothetical protein n=1 Tax=Iodobacter sp. CM08 TaxID=3085902 RepID=UPI002982858D|nr:hypothetical protein [Iodobacter sp. CM08]MDW5417710.1 hypothetical protein [Iodobacter sp. CM08]